MSKFLSKGVFLLVFAILTLDALEHEREGGRKLDSYFARASEARMLESLAFEREKREELERKDRAANATVVNPELNAKLCIVALSQENVIARSGITTDTMLLGWQKDNTQLVVSDCDSIVRVFNLRDRTKSPNGALMMSGYDIKPEQCRGERLTINTWRKDQVIGKPTYWEILDDVGSVARFPAQNQVTLPSKRGFRDYDIDSIERFYTTHEHGVCIGDWTLLYRIWGPNFRDGGVKNSLLCRTPDYHDFSQWDGALTADGSLLALPCRSKKSIDIWHVAGAKKILTLLYGFKQDYAVQKLAWCRGVPDKLATAFEKGGPIIVWDIRRQLEHEVIPCIVRHLGGANNDSEITEWQQRVNALLSNEWNRLVELARKLHQAELDKKLEAEALAKKLYQIELDKKLEAEAAETMKPYGKVADWWKKNKQWDTARIIRIAQVGKGHLKLTELY